MEKCSDRKKREEMQRLPGGSIFGAWKTFMAPATDEEVVARPSKFKARKGEGMRLASNTFPDNEGVYEVRVVPPGGTTRDAVVLYLGKAGGEDTKSSLRQRMDQYMRDGSHKGELYDSLLKGGCKLQVRVASKGMSTRSISSEEQCKALESYFLGKVDYAANKMENGKTRLNEVKIKANGKEVSLKAFSEKYGYKEGGEKHAEARPRTKKTARKERCEDAKDPAAAHPKPPAGAKIKADGTPDRRYKENKARVVPTPTRTTAPRSSARSTTSSSSRSYGGSSTPMTKSGRPDKRFSVNKGR